MVIKSIATILFSQSGQHCFRKFLQDIEAVIFTVVVKFVKILSGKYKWGYSIGILVSVYSGRIYCTIWVILNVRLMSDLHNANSFIRIFCQQTCNGVTQCDDIMNTQESTNTASKLCTMTIKMILIATRHNYMYNIKIRKSIHYTTIYGIYRQHKFSHIFS